MDDGMLVWVQTVLPFVQDLNFGHFISYFILALTIYLALGPKWMSWRGRCLTIALCVLYGITDEIHQHYIPGRTPDLIDIRNDMIGAMIAMLVVIWSPIHRLYLRMAGGKKY